MLLFMLILIKFYLNGDFMHDQVVKFDTVYTTLTISQIRWEGELPTSTNKSQKLNMCAML